MNKKTVLRVGVYNNFNFTKDEIAAVAQYADDYLPFVNSNSFVTISSEYPSIITINPYLDSWQPPTGDLSNLKACRVKWVEGAVDRVYTAQMDAIDWCLVNKIPVLLTFMRFASIRSMSSFVCPSSTHLYQRDRSYYRLPVDRATEVVIRLVEYGAAREAPDLIYTCDLSGGGCPSCGNCSRLTYGLSSADVASLSLSCSGDQGKCIFHCPDCWAHRLGKITKFKYDEVTKNKKQKGKVLDE